MEEGMSKEDLEKVENAEYLNALNELLGIPSFRQFLVRWLVDTQPTVYPSVDENMLTYLNYIHGRASIFHEFMEGLKVESPDTYIQLTSEVLSYERRRNSAVDRDPGSPDHTDEYGDPEPFV